MVGVSFRAGGKEGGGEVVVQGNAAVEEQESLRELCGNEEKERAVNGKKSRSEMASSRREGQVGDRRAGKSTSAAFGGGHVLQHIEAVTPPSTPSTLQT